MVLAEVRRRLCPNFQVRGAYDSSRARHQYTLLWEGER